MVQNIREAFIENLKDVTWMDTDTKQAAKEKVKRMRTRHGRILKSSSGSTLNPEILFRFPSFTRKSIS